MARTQDDEEVVTFLEALPAGTGNLATVRADGYGTGNGVPGVPGVPGERLVRLQPAHIVALADVAD